jgi:hypothetical protein
MMRFVSQNSTTKRSDFRSHDTKSATYRVGKTTMVNFIGVIVAKLPNMEFTVKITHFPDGITRVPLDNICIHAKTLGKIRTKSIKFGIHDSVLIGISMEMAMDKSKSGIIVYRMKEKII